MVNPKPGPLLSRSLDRAMQVIELLAAAEEELSIAEMSKSLKLSKSTIHRILSTLTYRGYVEQDLKTRRYRLSLRIFELGSKVLAKLDLCYHARPFLKELMEQTNETVNLAIVTQQEIVIASRVESPLRIGLCTEVGSRKPLHCTAEGKLLLASMPEEEARKILESKGMDAFTPHTIISIDELMEHLQVVRPQGFAINDEEYTEGTRCVAAPVRDHRGEVVAAVSIYGPVVRMIPERLTELARYIKATTNKISMSLGYEVEIQSVHS